MTSTGPNFDFDGPLKIELHATPLNQAQAAYDAHLAKRVEYDPKLPCDHPHNEAARRWAREKHPLEDALTVAKAAATTITAFHPAPGPTPQPKCKRGQGRRLTAQGILANVMKNIATMATLTPGSPEWLRVQNVAYHNRAHAAKRAREDGETIVLPEIPHMRKAG